MTLSRVNNHGTSVSSSSSSTSLFAAAAASSNSVIEEHHISSFHLAPSSRPSSPSGSDISSSQAEADMGMPVRLSMNVFKRRMTPKHSKYPHQHQQRIATSLLSLALLVALSTFVFIAQSTALYENAYQERLLLVDPAERRLTNAPHSHNAPLYPTSHRHRQHRTSNTAVNFTPTLHLSQSQELAAVTSFLASLSSNILPPGVDPSKPIDPQLVLDFQLDPTRVGGAARVEEELGVMVRDVWARNPVFMYSRLHSPTSRELKSILGNLYLLPAPTIIDVDVRDDVDILAPMIKRLAGFDELPLLIIGGTPVGSLNEVKVLEKSGELARMVTDAGAVVNGAKRKRRRK